MAEMTELEKYSRCDWCFHWKREGRELSGRCRINPPSTELSTHRAVWPLTNEADYCGNWSQSPVGQK